MVPALLSAVGVRLARRSVSVTTVALLVALAWPTAAAAHHASTVTDLDGVVAERESAAGPPPSMSTLDEDGSAVAPTGPGAASGGEPAVTEEPTPAAGGGPRVAAFEGVTVPAVARSDDDRSGPWWAKVVAGVMVVLGVVSCVELIRRRGT